MTRESELGVSEKPKIFSLPLGRHQLCAPPSSFLFSGYWRLFHREKSEEGMKLNHSFESCNEVTKYMKLYLHSPICPHYVLYRDNFTLPFQFSVYYAGLCISRRLRLPGFLDTRHVRMARLSALRTGFFPPPPPPSRKIPLVLIFVRG